MHLSAGSCLACRLKNTLAAENKEKTRAKMPILIAWTLALPQRTQKDTVLRAFFLDFSSPGCFKTGWPVAHVKSSPLF